MGRIKVLDGLRALAVLIVMVSHNNLGHLVPGGFGVTIFFALSGYLITTLMRMEYENNHSISFAGFYLRRSVRIIPPMLFCYAVALSLVVSGLIDRPVIWAGVKFDLLFLTNYAPPLVPNSQIPIPLWSLDIEEHFYLLFPAIFFMILRLHHNRQTVVIGALIVLALAMRFFEYAHGNADFIYYWTHTRFDAILFGALLAVIQGDENTRRASWPHLIGGMLAILLSFVIRDQLFRETLRYTLQGAGLFFVFKFLIEGPRNPITSILQARPLKRVADWSYTLYLIHLPLFMTVEHNLWALPPPARVAAQYGAAFVFAVAVERFVERPLHSWRKRLEAHLQSASPRKLS